MKRWLLLLPVLFMCSCHREKATVWFSEQKALEYFSSVEEICNRDSGRLWGENLYGPIMYIDPETRRIYASTRDREGILRFRKGVYSGILPKERWINNISFEYGGTLYAMVPLPKKDDNYLITSRTIHSLFHCYQEEHNLAPHTFNTRHMNEKDARILLKLEWKALIKAFNSESPLREEAIKDALVFRNARREIFPSAAEDETLFENYEGLTTFTYMKLGSTNNDDLKAQILKYLDHIYSFTSFAYGYGFVHGALYSYLLDNKGFDFQIIQTPVFDLGTATAAVYGIRIPATCRTLAETLAEKYDLQSIRDEEIKNLEKIGTQTHNIISTFMEKPVLTLEMESPNFSFEPEDINLLDTLGTLYRRLRVSDNWGRLTVNEGGALVTNDLKTLRVNAQVLELERNHISGTGWQLVLNEGWEIIDNKENYVVRHNTP